MKREMSVYVCVTAVISGNNENDGKRLIEVELHWSGRTRFAPSSPVAKWAGDSHRNGARNERPNMEDIEARKKFYGQKWFF